MPCHVCRLVGWHLHSCEHRTALCVGCRAIKQAGVGRAELVLGAVLVWSVGIGEWECMYVVPSSLRFPAFHHLCILEEWIDPLSDVLLIDVFRDSVVLCLMLAVVPWLLLHLFYTSDLPSHSLELYSRQTTGYSTKPQASLSEKKTSGLIWLHASLVFRGAACPPPCLAKPTT